MIFAAEQARHARRVYAICKQIDGYPEVEGTPLIFGARVMVFDYLNERQAYYEPVSTYDELLNLTRINGRLLDGHAPFSALNRLLVAFRVFNSAYAAPPGALPLPDPGDPEVGAHAAAAGFGWAEAYKALYFKNSWGAGWGDRGYGFLSREYLDRYMVDAWLWRDARVGPSRFTLARLREASGPKEFAKAWMLENARRRWRFRHDGRGHRLHLYQTLSHTGSPVDVIEVRDGRGRRLGWAYLHHCAGLPPPRASVLKELFVWPAFRRRGYGRLLEAIAAERARGWRSSEMRILFHEADAMPRNRQAGREFAGRTGYALKWRRQARPNLAAIGEKALG